MQIGLDAVDRALAIEMLNESNVYDQAPEWLEYNREPPAECQKCRHLTEAYNEPINPEMAGEYLGLQCEMGGCDRG
jgi:hypothetical protein